MQSRARGAGGHGSPIQGRLRRLWSVSGVFYWRIHWRKFAQGGSSVGRAAVSQTLGPGVAALRPCLPRDRTSHDHVARLGDVAVALVQPPDWLVSFLVRRLESREPVA